MFCRQSRATYIVVMAKKKFISFSDVHLNHGNDDDNNLQWSGSNTSSQRRNRKHSQTLAKWIISQIWNLIRFARIHFSKRSRRKKNVKRAPLFLYPMRQKIESSNELAVRSCNEFTKSTAKSHTMNKILAKVSTHDYCPHQTSLPFMMRAHIQPHIRPIPTWLKFHGIGPIGRHRKFNPIWIKWMVSRWFPSSFSCSATISSVKYDVNTPSDTHLWEHKNFETQMSNSVVQRIHSLRPSVMFSFLFPHFLSNIRKDIVT